ncbi:MAG: hypothetical protein Cons2KO_25750 [Congregibacter sp.]
MSFASRINRQHLVCAVLVSLIGLISGCASGPQRPLTLADMQIVSSDDNFTIVALKRNQTTADLAQVFLGSPEEAWQILEVNANSSPKPGDLLAVPSRPVNPTGVYHRSYRTLPILCYHQFTNADTPAHKLELRARDFEAQLKFLRDNNYQILSFADASEIMSGERPMPEKGVVLTIDDGYASVYDLAWPLLQKYQAKATLFIYTDFIGAGAAMTWDELREMRDSGLIEIESHGKSHASLAPLPEDKSEAAYKTRLAEELSASEANFMARLGKPPAFLSYPYGNSSRIIADMLKDSGYSLAATVTRGPNASFVDPFLLHRTMIYDDHTLDEFAEFVASTRSRRRP